MCLKYGRFQPKRAYKARAYKKKKCICRKQETGSLLALLIFLAKTNLDVSKSSWPFRIIIERDVNVAQITILREQVSEIVG